MEMNDPAYDEYVYEIGPTDFLPNFVVFTNHIQSDKGKIPSEKFYWQPADARYFDVYFETYEFDVDGNQSTKRIEAILCDQYVKRAEGLSPIDKEFLRSEFESSDHSYQLCPDIDIYLLSQGWRQFVGQGLYFKVAPKEGEVFKPGSEYAQLIDETTIFYSMISRYFYPENYKENGQMDIVAVT